MPLFLIVGTFPTFSKKGILNLTNSRIYSENYELITWSNVYPVSYFSSDQFEIPLTDFMVSKFKDYGTDVDSNGLFDYLTVEVGLNINQAGNYTVKGFLSDSSGKPLDIIASNTAYLNTRIQTVELNFDGGRIRESEGGTFIVDVDLYNASDKLILRKNNFYTTHSYQPSSFERGKVVLTNFYRDYGRDTNSDGLFEYLTIEASVNCASVGKYSVRGYLYDFNDVYVAFARNETILSIGNQTVFLNFDGPTINSHGVSGNFTLVAIEIEDESGALISDRDVYYQTSRYRYDQFNEAIPTPTATISVAPSGRGEAEAVEVEQ